MRPFFFLVSLVCAFSCTHLVNGTSVEKLDSLFVLKKDVSLKGGLLVRAPCATVFKCSLLCLRNKQYASASFYPNMKKCFLHRGKMGDVLENSKPARGCIFMEKADPFEYPSPAYGSSKELAITSCKELKSLRPEATSGVYWIRPDPKLHAFQAHCDQETAGGGWTLVWSYTFTNYGKFSDPSNAVTPRPSWPVPLISRCRLDVPESKQTPQNEATPATMEFGLWRKLGNEFLIKSNINHWVKCSPNGGTLAKWVKGAVTCTKVRRVPGVPCWDFPGPRWLVPIPCGVALLGTERDPGITHFFFNADLRRGWPVHDPCGRAETNQLKGVPDPHGSVFIR